MFCYVFNFEIQNRPCKLASGCSGNGPHEIEKPNIQPDHTAMMKQNLCFYLTVCIVLCEHLHKNRMHNYCHCPEVAESRHSNHFGNFQGSVGLIRLIFLKHQSPCYKLRDNIKRTMARPYVTIEFRFKTSAATSLGNQP